MVKGAKKPLARINRLEGKFKNYLSKMQFPSEMTETSQREFKLLERYIS